MKHFTIYKIVKTVEKELLVQVDDLLPVLLQPPPPEHGARGRDSKEYFTNHEGGTDAH